MQVQVSARTISMPSKCPCCLEAAESSMSISASRTTGKRVVRTTTRGWNVPYCTVCCKHSEVWDTRFHGFFLLLLAPIACTAVSMSSTPDAGGATFLGAVALATILGALIFTSTGGSARRLCKPTCVGPGRAASYQGWDGTIQSFDFNAPEYAKAFAELNRGKLVNVDPALGALLRVTSASVAPAQHGSPAPIVPPPAPLFNDHDLAIAILQRLEGAKGPATRKAILERDLANLRSEEARQKVLAAAARIEVQATLDKVDQLKTAAAKRRHLLAALEGLKADQVPDSLQQEEIAMLEAALAAL
jgi:hypothetical protein